MIGRRLVEECYRSAGIELGNWMDMFGAKTFKFGRNSGHGIEYDRFHCRIYMSRRDGKRKEDLNILDIPHEELGEMIEQLTRAYVHGNMPRDMRKPDD